MVFALATCPRGLHLESRMEEIVFNNNFDMYMEKDIQTKKGDEQDYSLGHSKKNIVRPSEARGDVINGNG